MRYLELSRIKEHLNIDKDFTDDDLYLESLGDVAEQMVEQHLECNLDEFDKLNIPAPILHACFYMLVYYLLVTYIITVNLFQILLNMNFH